MSLKPNNREIQALRLLTLVVFGAFALGLFGVAAFLYHRVYESIRRAETIVLLKSDLGVEGIDFAALSSATSAWSKKYATTTISIARDPFIAATGTAKAGR